MFWGAHMAYTSQQVADLVQTGAVSTTPQQTPAQPTAPKPTGLLAPQSITKTPSNDMVQVDDNTTMHGLYNQYAAQDSLSKQLAETSAKERANSTGLLNTSMAVGEAQKARDVVDLTSAQADSNIYSTAKNTSAQLKNQSDIASMQEAGANSRLGQQLAMQKDLAQLDANTRLEVTNKTLANQMDMTRLDAETRTSIAKLDTDSRERMAAASLSSNETIAKMNVSASERGQFQSAVTQAMGNYANAINRIDLDPNLDPAGKAAARLSAETLMHNSMTAAAAVAGVEGISELWAA